jgi:uncharacterized glyoxalase superfamily protein PhnB
MTGRSATPRWRSGTLSSCQAARRGSTTARSASGGPAEVYLVVDDVPAHYERVVRAGAEVVMPLTDRGYGVMYTIRDPEGNVWSFGDYRPEPVA